MTVTINNTTSMIDPLNEYNEAQREQCFDGLELHQHRAIMERFPHADVECDRDLGDNLVLLHDGEESDGETLEAIQEILEDVFDTGLFWV